MSDVIMIHAGTRPWRPAEHGTETGEIYHRHDGPLIGTIHQAGSEFLFQCLAGEVERVNLWYYSLLHPGEKDLLDEVDGVDFDAVLRSHVEERGALALAVDGKILAWAEKEPGEKVATLLPGLFEQVDEWLEHMTRAAHKQRAALLAC